MTLVSMERGTFEILDDERLGWACMEPTFVQIRGKAPAVKREVIARLTEGQRALCMFRVLYDHAKSSPLEYYLWIHSLLDTPDYWNGVLKGLHFYEASNMAHFLEQTKEEFASRNSRLGRTWADASFQDLEQDAELKERVEAGYARFVELAQDSHRRVAQFIRANTGQYVILQE
ncbi:hypothetical protein [Paenibacillus turpanensis]|uniref:hypothetical protein n=1 Tax=Paenibacillus turpanensis TaxID=2689078 RepID=UPI00140D1960|nr:hypothetical protein [Paenibacillus turpanensis]